MVSRSGLFVRLTFIVGLIGLMVLLYGATNDDGYVADSGAIVFVGGTAIFAIMASVFAYRERKDRW